MISFLLCLLPVSSSAAENEGEISNEGTFYGDVNNDGIINISDVTTIQAFLVDLLDEDEIDYSRALVSDNKVISINDATYIQMRLAKLIFFFPAEEKYITQKKIYYGDNWNIEKEFENSVIGNINVEKIESYKVEKAKATSTLDKNLVEKTTEKSLISLGTGYCYIDIVDNDYYSEYEKSDMMRKNVRVVKLTVLPAPLTMVYVLGQSNAYGVNSENYIRNDNTGPVEDSIVCPDNQVFSTFIPYSQSRGIEASGNLNMIKCTKDNYLKFVPDSLNDNCHSFDGGKLIYPIYSLTSKGNGKTGPDSGFAYEYNKLSNDRVWMVNTAVGASSISDWKKDSNNYTLSKMIIEKCNKVKDAEINAGHFIAGKKIILWMQGEADKNMSYDEYYKGFTALIKQVDSDYNPDVFSIILARGCQISGYKRDYRDLSLTAPRLVQNFVSNSKDFPKVYIMSRSNELWITDGDTKTYFENKYPGGVLDYPLRDNSSLKNKLPDNLEMVHYDIHFGPSGHNENGMEAGRNTYYLLNNIYYIPYVNFLLSDGHFAENEIKVKGDSFKLSPRYEVPFEGKECIVSFDENVLSYDEKTQTFTFLDKTNTHIKYFYKDMLIKRVNVIVENQ